MRKHSTVLWSVIIVVVVFAFVIWGTNPGSRGGGPTGTRGDIYGDRITEEEFVAARKEAELGYFLMYGRLPDREAELRGFDLGQQIYLLLLRIHNLQERQMYAGAEAKAVAVANLLQGLQAQGADIRTLEQFEQAVLGPNGFSLADLDRVLEHRLASQQLERVEGLCGQLASPELIESIWTRENQAINVQAVFFSASNHLDSVTITPEALQEYFTNQLARYRTPEKIQVNYVAYPISNYLAKADARLDSITNLNEQIEAEYVRQGTNTYPDMTPEEAKHQIREELRRVAATAEASRDAAIFADKLWQQEPMKASDLEALATQEGLQTRVSSAFDRNTTPEELDVDMEFTKAAYALRDDEPHGGPIPGEHHVYVISLNQRVPSMVSPFEDVQDQVTEDYRSQQAALKARELGSAFAASLTNSLAGGTAFSEACKQAGYEPVSLPSLARNTRTLSAVEQHTSLGFFKQVAFSTPVGEASDFIRSGEGGFVLYVDALEPIDEARKQQELSEFADAVRQTLANEAVNLWFGTEQARGLVNTPLNRPPPGQLTTPGG